MGRMWIAGLLLAGCTSVENRLLYHPLPVPAGAAGPVAGFEELELRSADGNRIHARWYPCANAKGALLFCHGNAGNLEQRDELVKQLRDRLHRSVLIFDYPGYGQSTGRPSEAGCYAAADAAYDWLAGRFQHLRLETAVRRADQIVLFGKSLGGSVATDLASRRPHQALVLVKTFSSVPAVAQEQLPLWPSWLVHNRFDNLAKIPRCPRPVFIAQGERDRLIPLEHGQRLHAAAREPKQLFVLAGDHNDPLPESFFTAVNTFLAWN